MKPKKQIKELEKQLRKDPDNLVVRLKLAGAYHEVARVKEAVDLYRSVAVAYHESGRLAQAIAVCRSVLEFAPGQPETLELLAIFDRAQRESEERSDGQNAGASPRPDAHAGVPLRPEKTLRKAGAPERPDEKPLRKAGTAERPDDIDTSEREKWVPSLVLKPGPGADAMPAPHGKTMSGLSAKPGQYADRDSQPTPLPAPLAPHDADVESSVAESRIERYPLPIDPAPRGPLPEVSLPSDLEPVDDDLFPTAVHNALPPNDSGEILTSVRHAIPAGRETGDDRRPPPLPVYEDDEPTALASAYMFAHDRSGKERASTPLPFIEDAESRRTTTPLPVFEDAESRRTTTPLPFANDPEAERITTPLPVFDDPASKRTTTPLPFADAVDGDDSMTTGRHVRGGVEHTRTPASAATWTSSSPPDRKAGRTVDERIARAAAELERRSGNNPMIDTLPESSTADEAADRSSDTDPFRKPVRALTNDDEDELTDEATPPILASGRKAIREGTPSRPDSQPRQPSSDGDEWIEVSTDDYSHYVVAEDDDDEAGSDAGASRDDDGDGAADVDVDVDTGEAPALFPRLDEFDKDEETALQNVPPRPRLDGLPAIIHDDMELGDAFHIALPDESAPLGEVRAPLSIFSSLPREAVNDLAARMTLRHFDAGTVIVREGDPSEACYVIVSGEVAVLRNDPVAGEPVEIVRLDDGSVFGELALLANRHRRGSVRASKDCHAYEIPRRVLRELAASYLTVGPQLERIYRDRLLASTVNTAPFLRSLPESEVRSLYQRFETLRFDTGQPILREGSRAGGFYLIMLGSVDITRRLSDKRSSLIATLNEGSYFGDMALASGDPAQVSVSAAGPSELTLLPPEDFYRIIERNPELWQRIREQGRCPELENHQLLTGEAFLT